MQIYFYVSWQNESFSPKRIKPLSTFWIYVLWVSFTLCLFQLYSCIVTTLKCYLFYILLPSIFLWCVFLSCGLDDACRGFSFIYHSSVDKGGSLPCRITAPYMQGMRHLLDDSVLEESPCASSEGSLTGIGKQQGELIQGLVQDCGDKRLGSRLSLHKFLWLWRISIQLW